MEEISTSLWLVWVLIGFIGGYMLGRARSRGVIYTLLSIVIAVAFAIAGGWFICHFFGAAEQMQYFSLVGSVITCAFGLMIFSFCTRRRGISPPNRD